MWAAIKCGKWRMRQGVDSLQEQAIASNKECDVGLVYSLKCETWLFPFILSTDANQLHKHGTRGWIQLHKFSVWRTVLYHPYTVV